MPRSLFALCTPSDGLEEKASSSASFPYVDQAHTAAATLCTSRAAALEHAMAYPWIKVRRFGSAENSQAVRSWFLEPRLYPMSLCGNLL
jgi:hypothetical protein